MLASFAALIRSAPTQRRCAHSEGITTLRKKLILFAQAQVRLAAAYAARGVFEPRLVTLLVLALPRAYARNAFAFDHLLPLEALA
ncbi:MAG: hypothetical protein M3R43_09725, partial [Acidobacteriota bacterium]|nr:hypothetical protein [Acidobacteriota bacterium]